VIVIPRRDLGVSTGQHERGGSTPLMQINFSDVDPD
jgi:hypothetical protein